MRTFVNFALSDDRLERVSDPGSRLLVREEPAALKQRQAAAPRRCRRHPLCAIASSLGTSAGTVAFLFATALDK